MRKRERDRSHEDGDHQTDHDQIRDRHLKEMPVNVVRGVTQIDGRPEDEREHETRLRGAPLLGIRGDCGNALRETTEQGSGSRKRVRGRAEQGRGFLRIALWFHADGDPCPEA